MYPLRLWWLKALTQCTSYLGGITYITSVRDVGMDQVIVSINLNDSTRYKNVFSRGVRQLVQFNTTNSSVFSITC